SPGATASASPVSPSSSVCPSSPTASAHSPSPSASADAKSKKGIDTRVFRDIAKTDVSTRTDMSVGYRGPKLSLRRKPVWHGRIVHTAPARLQDCSGCNHDLPTLPRHPPEVTTESTRRLREGHPWKPSDSSRSHSPAARRRRRQSQRNQHSVVHQTRGTKG